MYAKTPDFHDGIAAYYTARIRAHGATPRGVDWNDRPGQWLRFEQLARIFDVDARFSVNDLGCGYGALLGFLAERYAPVQYAGFDLSPEMIRAGRKHHSERPDAVFVQGSRPDRKADFGLASGIFNVRLSHGDAVWRDHILATLSDLDRTSRRGFAFNCLTHYADPERKRADLYYADPCYFFDVCKQRFSNRVALLHDYGLFEFTILVRKA